MVSFNLSKQSQYLLIVLTEELLNNTVTSSTTTTTRVSSTLTVPVESEVSLIVDNDSKA
jgi:hypothetical protein